MNPIMIAAALAVINTKLIDYLKQPIEKQYPQLNLWWLVYVALLTGIGLTWMAQVNVFAAYFSDQVFGVLLTGAFVGGGSSLLYDVVVDPARTHTRLREGALTTLEETEPEAVDVDL